MLLGDRGPCLEELLAGRVEIPERTPDGHGQVWLLYRPEPFAFDSDDDRAIHLWMRRCDVFTSRDTATAFLSDLLGHPVAFRNYAELTGGWFPELWIYTERGQRWLLCPGPLDPPGGQR